MNRKWLPVLLVVVVAAALPAAAQSTRPQDDDRVVTLTYDIGDLLLRPMDYPLGGGAGDNAPGAPAASQSATIDQWQALIKDTVASESWRDNGGTIGSIRAIQNVLVVTQTRANHDALATLLAQFREGGPMTMLSVRAYWIKLEPQEVAAIFAARKPRSDGGPLSEMPEVADSLLDKAHLYYMGQTTCFNAQTVMVTSMKEKTYISDVTPIVGQNAVGYDPTISVASDGVKLQVTPQMMPSSDAVVLDLHSDVVQNNPGLELKPTIATSRPSIDPQAMTVQSREGTTQQLQTTVRVPLNKRVLIGGMTFDPGDSNNNPRQLYLAVEVNAMR
jgi:hypothetical protein